MPGPFAKIGGGLDWLFGEVAHTAKGAVSAPEVKRVVGVGIASAIAGGTPFLAAAAATHSRAEMLHAVFNGFLTGVAGATVSYLHRKCDDRPPPPPYYGPTPPPAPPNDPFGPPFYGLPPTGPAAPQSPAPNP